MEGQGNRVNNSFYEELGNGWYEDAEHPIALLRAENATRNPWILKQIQALLGSGKDILDIGCGAGFLSNYLAGEHYRVTGVDISAKSLSIAQQRDATRSVQYMHADAFHLSFNDQSFDVVCAMDFLEHVEMPGQIVREASRLLRPGGLFFFHTFNRNWLSYLLVIKGVEWFVPNTPANMHVYAYFIKPAELTQWCAESGLTMLQMRGLTPCFASKAFWKSFLHRKVDPALAFRITHSLSHGYLGFAQKK